MGDKTLVVVRLGSSERIYIKKRVQEYVSRPDYKDIKSVQLLVNKDRLLIDHLDWDHPEENWQSHFDYKIQRVITELKILNDHHR